MSLIKTAQFDNVSFNPLVSKKKQHIIASSTFGVVVLLHLCVAIYLIKRPEVKEVKPIFTMAVEMTNAQKTETKTVTPPAPPVIKAPEKPKPIKPQPIIKKTEPVLPKAKEAEPIPMATKTPVASPPVSTPSPVTPSSSVSATPTSNKANTSTPTVSSGVVPISRVEAEYPAIAKRREIEGWVKIEFSITPDGSVENAVVVDAEPENIFNESALTAIEQWKFKGKIVDGVAVSQRAVQKLQFKLEH
ncbi:MAG: TonB family protein [Methylococcales bacterium]|nr:TonB family protein [Methylococcales bacterium]